MLPWEILWIKFLVKYITNNCKSHRAHTTLGKCQCAKERYNLDTYYYSEMDGLERDEASHIKEKCYPYAVLIMKQKDDKHKRNRFMQAFWSIICL